jgi:hypothetical protein
MKDLTPEQVETRAARLAEMGMKPEAAAGRIQRIKDQRDHGAWTDAQCRAFNLAYPEFFPASHTQKEEADPMPSGAARYYAKCVDNQHREAERTGRL